MKRVLVVLVALAFVLGIGGCVSQSKYQKKEAEFTALQGEMEALSKDKDKLSKQNETLSKERALYLKADATKNEYIKSLVKANEGLSLEANQLKNKLGALTVELDEISKRYASLEEETKKLKEAITAVELKPAKADKNSSQKSSSKKSK